MGLWGVFPNTITGVPWTICFTTPTPAISTMNCSCDFNQTVTPAIVGYSPNILWDTSTGGTALSRGQVTVSFTDYGASSGATSSEASITVNVYSPWLYYSPNLPLIGSLGPVPFTYGSPGSNESYTIFTTTLPDPMTFNVTVPQTTPQSDANEFFLNFDFTYGDQTFSINGVENGTLANGYFDIAAPPPGTWWDVLVSY